MKIFRALRMGLGITAGLLASVGIASAADVYPSRPVTIIIPQGAGGGTDLMTRMIAGALEKKFKQPFVVENRTGGATMVGAGAVARAAPDGYTILLSSNTTFAINPAIYKKMPYDPIKDFDPITLVNHVPFVLVVNPKLGVSNVKDLIALLKSAPGKYTFGSGGAGTLHHLDAELFMSMTGTKMRHIPYKSTIPSIKAVERGEVSLEFTDLLPAKAAIAAGKLKLLAVTSAHRLKSFPDVPTVAEAGVPGYVGIGWEAVVAPKGTPKEIVAALNGAIREYLDQPAVQDKIRDLTGYEIQTSTPEELGKYMASEIEKMKQVAKEAQIKPM